MKDFDVIVVGAGHAGVEAALAAARLGMRTLLLCTEEGTVANMPCNPSIGGTAKGHLVREVDALGGEMGVCADKALLQIKMLNATKGPAVYSLRGQEDKGLYHKLMLATLSEQEGLELAYDEVVDLDVEDGRIEGVLAAERGHISCRAVVLATGVYLSSSIITGEEVKREGPSGFLPARKLSEALIRLGLPLRRFKTGTPARIYRDSIDFSKTELQSGNTADRFSFLSEHAVFEEEPCYLTYTNEQTHEIIRQNISLSPLYNGTIVGVGPRYCPSIETKVMRFPNKTRHQVFIEPEGLRSELMYIQGMSTSLPASVQELMYRTIPGLEDCRFAKYGYAIEYDCLDPQSLYPSLQSKLVAGLYSAGQFNGSSGYEEAAAQGIIAGINAAASCKCRPPLILGRDEAYIGVLIDDLVTKGTLEPYRMMTARAEHRIMLRQDNADMRLTPIGYEIGLASEKRYRRMLAKKEEIARVLAHRDDVVRADCLLRSIGEEPKPVTIAQLCRRPQVSAADIKPLLPFETEDEALEAAVIELKYEGYLEKEKAAVREQRRLEEKPIPADFDYGSVHALRAEAIEKLSAIRPLSLGQASRISGVSPADIAVLIVALRAN